MKFANTPEPPYYVVIFTTMLTGNEVEEYEKKAHDIEELVKNQPGFLGIESSRTEIGITLSYWDSIDAIKNWKNNSQHLQAQIKGKSTWYKSYKLRIAVVEKDYGFNL